MKDSCRKACVAMERHHYKASEKKKEKNALYNDFEAFEDLKILKKKRVHCFKIFSHPRRVSKVLVELVGVSLFSRRCDLISELSHESWAELAW